jgi:hypothetical protein
LCSCWESDSEEFWTEKLADMSVVLVGRDFFACDQVRLIDNIGYLELYGYEFIFIQREW